jgi:hypothetical protein
MGNLSSESPTLTDSENTELLNYTARQEIAKLALDSIHKLLQLNFQLNPIVAFKIF